MADDKPKPPAGQAPAPQTIVVGEKTYTPEEIQGIIQTQTTLKTQLEGLAPVREALTRYELKPEELVEQASGAFAMLNQLVEEGLIDETGKVKKSQAGDPPKVPPVVPGVTPEPKPADPKASDPGTQALLSKITLLETALGNVTKSLTEIDRTQSSLLRTNIEKDLKAQYPALDSEDVSKVLVIASKDRKKDIFAHAKEMSEKKTQSLAALREAHAKEFGIDLKEFDANKLNEPGADKGAAGMFKGKSFSFKGKGKDSVSPRQAAMEFLRKQRGA